MLKRLVATFFAAALVCSAACADQPPTQRTGTPQHGQKFYGPGSRGFLPTCSSTFTVTNFVLASNNFSSTSWVKEGSTSPAIATPTVTGGAPDPNGGNSAFSVTFPAVSGTDAYSVLSQTINDAVVNDYPRTFIVTAKVTSGATNGSIYVAVGSGSAFWQVPIPSDGNWHVVKTAPGYASGLGANPQLQIGISLLNAQSPSTGPITISLFTSAYIRDPISEFIAQSEISEALATTTGAVSAPITIPCPPGVAFRDFRAMLPRTGRAPFTSKPPIVPNPTELYQAGSVGIPFSPLYYDGFYWAFANNGSSITPSMLVSFSLYKSPDGLNWTEDTQNAPYLTAFGSVLAAVTVGNSGGSGYTPNASGVMTWAGTGCTVPPVLNVTTNSSGAITTATLASGACPFGRWPKTQTTWTPSGIGSGTRASFSFATTAGTGLDSQWKLHPEWLPFGCTVSGTIHKFCILFDSRGTSNSIGSAAIYLAYADTIDGVYTIYGCTSGTCASPTPVIPSNAAGTGSPTGTTANSLAGVLNVGGPNGTNFIYTSINAENAQWTMIYTTPASGANAGTVFTFKTLGLQPLASGVDWDFGANYQDNDVFLNKCGFYEYFYTSEGINVAGTGKGQVISYAVSNNPYGPWWKWTGPIIPPTSPMYFGMTYIGNSAVNVANGRFIWSGNTSNGQIGVTAAAVMPDYCS